MTPIVPVYGVPTVAPGSVGEEKVNPPPPPIGLIVRLSGPLVNPCGTELSVTLMIRFEVPATVGVPLMVQPVSERPKGRTPPVREQA